MQTQPAHLNSDHVPGIKVNTTSTAWGDASSAISFTCRRPHRSWRVRSALPFLTCVHVPGNKVNTTSAEWGDESGAISIDYCRPHQLSHVCLPRIIFPYLRTFASKQVFVCARAVFMRTQFLIQVVSSLPGQALFHVNALFPAKPTGN